MPRALIWRSLMLLCVMPTAHAETLTVYAATSLTQAVNALAKSYQVAHPEIQVHTSFASSATLARQISAGSPAQVFISADQAWMDELAKQQKIVPNTRTNLLANRLVLIAPRHDPIKLSINKGINLSQRMTGRLCMGNPDSVPAGRYGKQALAWMGWYHGIAERIVPTEDVRSALAFVERGDCQVGIVYQTDALISQRVKTLAMFPVGSHDPIIYPIAAVGTTASPAALQFLAFMRSRAQQPLWNSFGFAQLSGR